MEDLVSISLIMVALVGLPDEKPGTRYLALDDLVVALARAVGRTDFIGPDEIFFTLTDAEANPELIRIAH